MQITRTTPLRRMILQLRHIFFTDASTFIVVLLAAVPSRLRWRATGDAAASDPCPLTPDSRYFALNVIRARERSYGVSSTVTLSPGRILM